ncbi:MAG: leucine-rich repeat domain-containing protein, partial [Christensenellaceae bacterium]|jgi:hypothetical protein|nr:leucine-rich repeat domain-containing protein [Christensenellaceae bacterium]
LNNPSSDVTLRAVWEYDGPYIFFDAKDITSGAPPEPLRAIEENSSAVIFTIPDSSGFEKAGYGLAGWSLDKNATDADFLSDTRYLFPEFSASYDNFWSEEADPDAADFPSVTLYAVWSEIIVYSVIYGINGIESEPLRVERGSEILVAPLPQDAVCGENSEYIFAGWAFNSEIYSPYDRLSALGNITFTAVWQAPSTVYSVSYIDWDGTIIGIEDVIWGNDGHDVSFFNGIAEFTGFDTDITCVKANIVAAAQYDGLEFANEGQLSFDLVGGGYSVSKGLSFTGGENVRLVIPPTYNGKYVTAIANQGFLQTDGDYIQGVYIPSTVTAIGSGFSGANIGSLIFADESQVTVFSRNAFRNANIGSLYAPISLETIQGEAFSGECAIEIIHFATVMPPVLGADGFGNNYALSAVYVPSEEAYNNYFQAPYFEAYKHLLAVEGVPPVPPPPPTPEDEDEDKNEPPTPPVADEGDLFLTYIDWDGTVISVQNFAEDEEKTVTGIPLLEQLSEFVGYENVDGLIYRSGDLFDFSGEHTLTAVYRVTLANGETYTGSALAAEFLSAVERIGELSENPVAISGENYTFGANEGYMLPKHIDLSTEKLIIPPTYNGKLVLETAESAFENSHAAVVYLPSSIVKMGAFAWSGGYNNDNAATNIYLEYVTLPARAQYTTTSDDGGKEMYSDMFNGCINLKAVVIPEGWNNLSAPRMFANCTSLEEITIPSTIVSYNNSILSNSSVATLIVKSNGIPTISIGGYSSYAPSVASFTIVFDIENNDYGMKTGTVSTQITELHIVLNSNIYAAFADNPHEFTLEDGFTWEPDSITMLE